MTTEVQSAGSVTADPGSGPLGDEPTGTGSTTTRVLGIALLVSFALLAFLGLFGTPQDRVQGELVRLLYIHPQTATTAYIGCFLATVGSAMYLWKRSVWWDIVAVTSAEIAAVFTALALVTGALWGRPAWGTFWVWDPRLTSTAMLQLLLMGYLALRNLPGDPDTRARQAAVVGLLLVPNVVLVRQSVVWWRSLHQEATLALPSVQIEGLQLTTMLLSFVLFAGLFVWLAIHRFRIGWLRRQVDELAIDEAIEARRAETAGRS